MHRIATLTQQLPKNLQLHRRDVAHIYSIMRSAGKELNVSALAVAVVKYILLHGDLATQTCLFHFETLFESKGAVGHGARKAGLSEFPKGGKGSPRRSAASPTDVASKKTLPIAPTNFTDTVKQIPLPMPPSKGMI